MSARALAVCALLAAAGCGDDPDVVPDANTPDAEAPGFGCFEEGPWSPEVYEGEFEGAPYTSESMYGTVDGQPVGRTQLIRLRFSHEYSLDTYSTDVLGDEAASGWMWHARCANGDDFYSEWQTITENIFPASGCVDWIETTYFRIRVRAANC